MFLVTLLHADHTFSAQAPASDATLFPIAAISLSRYHLKASKQAILAVRTMPIMLRRSVCVSKPFAHA